MTRRERRNHSPEFKAEVAMAAMRGDKTLVELAQQYDVHANQIQDWKKRLLAESESLFEIGEVERAQLLVVPAPVHQPHALSGAALSMRPAADPAEAHSGGDAVLEAREDIVDMRARYRSDEHILRGTFVAHLRIGALHRPPRNIIHNIPRSQREG